ncbi:MAG: 6-bladed beta-propeller [Balneolaceae bacterium]
MKKNIPAISHKNWGVIFCLGCLLFGCKAESDVKKTAFTEYIVKNTQVFLSAEETPLLGRPTAIKAVSDGLFIVDVGHYQVTKVDKEGNQLLSFGDHGRGPAEFQTITGFWPFKNEYLMYDYNSFKFLTFDKSGKLIDEEVLNENPVNPGSEFSIPITLDALSSDKLLIPSGGRNGSLFAIADRNSGDVSYFGKAVGESVQEYNNPEVMQAYSRGEIPDILLNMVMLSSSSNGIYSFQQTTGVLEKYTHAGEQAWEMELNISEQRNLFDQIAEHNKEGGSDNGRRMFIYARAIDALEEGVALLLNMPEDNPVTVAWIPEDGSRIDLIKIEGLNMDVQGFMEGFTVSPGDQRAYYLERSIGTIYEIDWPL